MSLLIPVPVGCRAAPLLEVLLAHLRERRVLRAGGARAEAERRQAVADVAKAMARIATAEAEVHEARARLGGTLDS
ncbi:hypothetical protein [Baekduia sp. Peel2402]|uniref:hypothetical protein n=1 Tax=Baekduia sp. Peel2402 TaxID=3458296 RepID=UPI00403E791E